MPKVIATVESVQSLAARLPRGVVGVVEVPRLHGWASRKFSDLMTRVTAAAVRAVSSHEMRHDNFVYELDSEMRGHFRRVERLEASKRWCIAHRSDPDALQALCECAEAPLDDEALLSAVVDNTALLGEMGRTRVVKALARRIMTLSMAMEHPRTLARVTQLAMGIDWPSVAHEEIAGCVARLDAQIGHDGGGLEARRCVEQLLQEYVQHPRVAVLESLALDTVRVDLLAKLCQRAQQVAEVDERLGWRLVAAIASNPATPGELLRPFAQAQNWTQDGVRQGALGALLQRAVVAPSRSSEMAGLEP